MTNPFEDKHVYITGRLGKWEDEPIVSRLIRLGAQVDGAISMETDILIVGAGGSMKVMDKYDALRMAGSDCQILTNEEVDTLLFQYWQSHYSDADWQRHWQERRHWLTLSAMARGHTRYFLSEFPDTGDGEFTIERLSLLSGDELTEAFRRIEEMRENRRKEQDRQDARRWWLKVVVGIAVILLVFMLIGFDRVFAFIFVAGLFSWVALAIVWIIRQVS